MKLLNIAHSCLSDILYKEMPFKLAIENSCQKNTIFKDERKLLANIVGCSLRHYYIYEDLISRTGIEFSPEQKIALYISLSNNLFLSCFASKDINRYYMEKGISNVAIEKINEVSSDKTKLIPSQYKNDSPEYLHFRFNIPLWTLKMWFKHFKGYTYKIVKSLNKPGNHYGILNKSLLSEEDLHKKHKELQPSNFEGLYLYQGSVAPSRHSLFKEGKMALINPAEYSVLKELNLDVIRNIALYSEVFNNLHLQLMAELSNKYHMDIIAGTSEAFYGTKKDLDTYHLLGVNLYNTGHSSIITCLSDKVDNFFVMPKNTNFSEFRKSPDYFNRVKQDELDEYIANQKKALSDASDFVNDNGNLIYIVETMNKKESVQIIEAFLNEHKDFTLVKHHQFLPFDEYDSALYYAIMRKESND